MKLLNSSKVVLFIILFLASVFNVQAEEEVDIWKEKVSNAGDKPGNYYTVTNDNGPVRFDPENDFYRQENKNYLKQKIKLCLIFSY